MPTRAGSYDGLRSGALLFLLGDLWLQQFAHLPDPRWAWVLLPLLPAAWRLPVLRPPCWFLAGFFYASTYAAGLLAQTLPNDLEGVDMELDGVIASIPYNVGERKVFLFDSEARSDPALPPMRLRLSWYGKAPDPGAGQRWRLTVRLKRPHGFSNPGAFDYEAYLFHRHIRAKGYVRHAPANRLLDPDPPGYAVARLRQRIASAITQVLGGSPYTGLVQALAVGERHAIGEDQWQVLRRSGTSHLLAISGLHIGLVAGLVFFLVRRLWSLSSRLVLFLPAPVAAAAPAFGAALGYALLAGLSISSQRALIMVATVLAAILLDRKVASSRILALACLAVLMLDPLAVLSAGFWLSFGAVGLILYGMSGRPAMHNLWWRWGRVQWVVAVGLLPILLFLFQQAAWVAPVANLFAIPWVSFGVVPLVLLGAVLAPLSPALAAPLLHAADLSLHGLWPLLETLATLPGADWIRQQPSPGVLLVATLGAVLLLAPRGLPGRWLGLLGLLPLFVLQPPRPAPGTAWFTLIDIGHGLAALVQTEHHTLLFDTGPRLGPRFDGAKAAVIPLLRQAGIGRIDLLVLSHGDSDHTGGARSLFQAVAVDTILTSVPERYPSSAPCQRGQEWAWDGVRFRILHPPPGSGFTGNNRSCVLRVETGGGSVLITADIERQAEQYLLAHGPAEDLRADILVAPHQGSRTSSTAAFVAAVRPRFVLFPVAYRNRYHHPHPQVVERYRAIGARIYDSARHGALSFVLGTEPPIAEPAAYRVDARRYWHTHIP